MSGDGCERCRRPKVGDYYCAECRDHETLVGLVEDHIISTLDFGDTRGAAEAIVELLQEKTPAGDGDGVYKSPDGEGWDVVSKGHTYPFYHKNSAEEAFKRADRNLAGQFMCLCALGVLPETPAGKAA